MGGIDEREGGNFRWEGGTDGREEGIEGGTDSGVKRLGYMSFVLQ